MCGCAFRLHPNVRWLGDRKDIQGQTKVWDKVILDRQAELSEWADILAKVYKKKVPIYAYANNHYAGHGPATVARSLERPVDRREANWPR
jgi:uncharacterized protein YecE (DUF72 family)